MVKMSLAMLTLVTELLMLPDGAPASVLMERTSMESGSVYPLLTRLVAAGHVSLTEPTDKGGGATYELTTSGRIWARDSIRPSLARFGRLASHLATA